MPKFQYNSRNINYTAKGSGELLIILPGNTASSIAYELQIDVLSNYFHVACIDYLGTGKSDRIKDIKENWWQYSSEQVIALIVHLGYEKALLAGTSGGAVVAMHAAANYPDMVKALILDSFSIRFSHDMFTKNVVQERQNITEDQEGFWKFCHGEDWRSVVDWDTQNIKRIVENGGNWLEECPEKIECQTLLLGSEKDVSLPGVKQDFMLLSKQIPNCEIAFSSTGNHPLMWTNTLFYFDRLKKFLKIYEA